MPTGTVKWFNNAKGYGFILPEGGGDDLFVHYSSIHMDGYKTLKAGQPVEYDTHEGDKGCHATNVRSSGVIATAAELPVRTAPRPALHSRPMSFELPDDGVAAAMLSAAHDD